MCITRAPFKGARAIEGMALSRSRSRGREHPVLRELEEELSAMADPVDVHVLEVFHRQVGERSELDLVERKVWNVVLHLALPENLANLLIDAELVPLLSDDLVAGGGLHLVLVLLDVHHHQGRGRGRVARGVRGHGGLVDFLAQVRELVDLRGRGLLVNRLIAVLNVRGLLHVLLRGEASRARLCVSHLDAFSLLFPSVKRAVPFTPWTWSSALFSL